MQQGYKIDTSNMEGAYNEGKHFLSARHILFQVPQGQEATGSDSVMKRAESVRRQINDKNFAAMAKQHGSDGTKDQGGDLGVFPPQQMVPQFSAAVAALKPGEIGPLVHTQFGYHIVRRNTFAEARQQFAQLYAQTLQQTAQSTYFAEPRSGQQGRDQAECSEGREGSRRGPGSAQE